MQSPIAETPIMSGNARRGRHTVWRCAPQAQSSLGRFARPSLDGMAIAPEYFHCYEDFPRDHVRSPLMRTITTSLHSGLIRNPDYKILFVIQFAAICDAAIALALSRRALYATLPQGKVGRGRAMRHARIAAVGTPTTSVPSLRASPFYRPITITLCVRDYLSMNS